MISPEHRTNFFKLIAYLESGQLKAQFTMARICEDAFLPPKAKVKNCGKFGDPLGHGPYAGIAKLPGESWAQYRLRAFGVAFNTDDHLWIFGALWSKRDNSAHGAAQRIKIYLEHGVPEDWREIAYPKNGSPSIEDRLILIHENSCAN